jgi:hypothetical protein
MREEQFFYYATCRQGSIVPTNYFNSSSPSLLVHLRNATVTWQLLKTSRNLEFACPPRGSRPDTSHSSQPAAQVLWDWLRACSLGDSSTTDPNERNFVFPPRLSASPPYSSCFISSLPSLISSFTSFLPSLFPYLCPTFFLFLLFIIYCLHVSFPLLLPSC